MVFGKHDDEVITTHGFSNNEVNIWNLKKLKKTHTLMGHTSRVLYLAMSPDGNNIVTGAGDETLRFWNLNYNTRGKNRKDLFKESYERRTSIFDEFMFR